MAGEYTPIDPSRLPEVLADDLVAADVAGRALRVAIDGLCGAQPHALADALVAPLRLLGRDVARVRADMFWRDASLRLEHGRNDVESFRHDWLDAAALRREVLQPLGPGGAGAYLPSLRDPATNRVTRAHRRMPRDGAILIVSGELLLGRGLPFDRTIHLALGSGARARTVPAQWAWTLPAFADYDRDVDPVAVADIVIRFDDPRHPAIRRSTPF